MVSELDKIEQVRIDYMASCASYIDLTMDDPKLDEYELVESDKL